MSESASLTIQKGAFVASNAHAIGSFSITVKSGAVVHPLCVLDATHGDIVIGEGAIICERCHIAAPSASSDRVSSAPGDAAPSGLQIGAETMIEVGTKIEASKVSN